MGHTGTLDPFATGLLVVLVGRATRLSQFLVGLCKAYSGSIRLGLSTDTHDCTGEVTREDDAWQTIPRDRIDMEMRALEGRHAQRPPAFSALKVGGERAYRLARKGRTVDLAARDVEVFEFAVTELNGADLAFRCDVSSGTYVRALARDLGENLGCGAHLRTLRRESVGAFDINDAQSLGEIETGEPLIRPSLEAIEHMERYSIEGDELREKLVCGQRIPAPDGPDGMIAVSSGQELVAIAERRDGLLKPRVVLEGQG